LEKFSKRLEQLSKALEKFSKRSEQLSKALEKVSKQSAQCSNALEMRLTRRTHGRNERLHRRQRPIRREIPG
jgi:hypothetical protein